MTVHSFANDLQVSGGANFAQRRATKKAAFLDRLAAQNSKIPKARGGGVHKKAKRRSSLSLENLDDLSQSLGDVGNASTVDVQPKGVGSLRMRQCIAKQEAPRLLAVLNHPEFKKDPLSAIKMHISSSLPPKPQNAGSEIHKKAHRKEKKKRQKAAKQMTEV